jgi:hypothetical protein
MWTWRFPEMSFATRRGLRVKALWWAGPSRWPAGSGRADLAEVNRKLAAFGQTEK